MKRLAPLLLLVACGGRVDEPAPAPLALAVDIEPGCIAREVQRPGSVDAFYACSTHEVIVAAQAPSTHPMQCGACPSGATCFVTLATPSVPSPYGSAEGKCL